MIDLIQNYWRPFLFGDGHELSGLVITLWLLIGSVFLGFVLALPLAIARSSRIKCLNYPVWIFSYIFRGTPLYIQLLLLYSGIFSLEIVQDSATLRKIFSSGINCALIAFTLNTCAYSLEIFAGAIKETSKDEIAAGLAFGMSQYTLYRLIILPSALRRSLPQYSNEVVLMLHATTLAFTVTVPDILKVARDANSETYLVIESFTIAAILYACLSFILIGLFKMAEKRWLKHLQH